MSVRELRRHVGRLAIVGFSGHSAPEDLRRLIAAFDLGGVIYFARNVVAPAQVAELSREIVALERDWPFWISVDQEGGRVARLRAPFTEWPPAATLGRSGDVNLARRFGAALAAELRAVGITLDYAPVLDVHTNPANAVIGDRAFASRPAEAARLGAAVLEGLQQAGVSACGKHFPGHGDTILDSHDQLPVVEHDRARLEVVEFVPFRRAIEAGVATIMTAHVVSRAIDPDRIATMSPAVVGRVLKEDLGFGGVVMSDDLGMKAISATMPLAEAAVAAVQAGCDVVLLCNSTVDEQVGALEALIRAAESGEIAPERLEDALARQQRVKERFAVQLALPAPPLEAIGSVAHQAVAREMAAWA
jgi:beta-N-acetylhexosaminidase